MVLNDFFETNTIYLETIELFEEYRIETTEEFAINKSRQEILKRYDDEMDMQTLVYMSSYWISLKSGFIDKKSKDFLDTLSKRDIDTQFGENESQLINEIIGILLEETPQNVKKNKYQSSNQGAYTWKTGDIYAYKLTEKDTKDEKLCGKYILIYCIENNVKSKSRSDVTAYLLIKKNNKLFDNLEDNINDSEFLPNRKENGLFIYRNWLSDANNLYPQPDKLRYIGNIPSLIYPKNELIPPPIFNNIIVWKWFGEDIEKMLFINKNI